jgi:hypothetical protein
MPKFASNFLALSDLDLTLAIFRAVDVLSNHTIVGFNMK